MKKGQGALEYLMTYGWALLIIVVVGAALYALGILNPASYVKSTCSGFTYFQYRDQKLDAGNYTLVVLNSDQEVNITGLRVNSKDAVMRSPANTTSPGKQETINGDVITGKAPGDSYDYEVVITYNVMGGISGKTDRATCTGKVMP